MNPRVSQWRQARVRIELVVTAEERAHLAQVADETRGTVAGVIREAVAEYCGAFLERRGHQPPAEGVSPDLRPARRTREREPRAGL